MVGEDFSRFSAIVLTTVFAFGLARINAVSAATAVDLGSADNFVVLGGSTVTNTGSSVLNGDLGLSPGTSVTGFPPGTLNGTSHVADATAVQAKVDLVTAYTNAAGQTPVSTVATELGGTTKTSGVYNSASGTFGITGTLTLDAQGDPNAVFIFKTASTLITAGASTVSLINSAQACNVFWQVGSSATLGATSTFKGNILALTSATLTTRANVEGRVLARNGAVTLDTNTITRATCAPVPATLRVIKTVTNDNGGTAVRSDFNLHVMTGGADVADSPAPGVASPGTAYTLTAGTYAVSEDVNTSYTQSFTGDCDASGNITLAAGEDKTCRIINNDIPATLHVIKRVVNNDGGTAVRSDFNLYVKNGGVDVSGSPAPGAASPGTAYTLDAGAYVVSEDAFFGYNATFSGDCDATGHVTLSLADDQTCTITNNDMAAVVVPTATINVVKTVVNDNGGTKTVGDFPLFVGTTSVISGETNTFSAPATYTVSETDDPNYTQTISGDCNSNGQMALNPGDNLFCIITNNDIAAVVVPPNVVPPIIDVVKVPNLLSLPDGPGKVEYTYTLTNIGTLPVTDITLVGDTCSPIVLISGDANADAKLDLNETWTFTCTTTLQETHTNTVVATGWANGISATDIASATVVVGVPVVPPLIHVTKIPDPLALSVDGGLVTYTETITNPGTVPLSHVTLSDDKCSPLTFVSGDINDDSKLDPTESWVYTCQTNLTETTTNTAVATGEANGLIARDFAIITVVVATALPSPTDTVVFVPGLPDTGVEPEQ